ncbi:hypothetical protein RclHR1_02500028 [Rhizophagus clarus]|uniref:Uncharacterized protein n=1 Tax=Rhizophagus clarus TaxID=94130 RepID=A0A2Z6RCH5_9GLOM|nr:hypothetical protein RclHR1_02500028 [Rhizophagus clarus]GET01347.1 hypothetical protein GLOIN_2v1603049 [Rhizophagus clarus]
MLKFFGSKKQATSTTEKQHKTTAAASTTTNTTLDHVPIPDDNKIIPELAITPPLEGNRFEENDSFMFKEALNYVVVRSSPNSNDIEILHPIAVPKEFVNNPETENLEIVEDNKNEKEKDKPVMLSGEQQQILHEIYSKQIIKSKNSLYQCTLKQIYNDYIIGEAKRISSVGEPVITIHTPQLETELRRTGALSNTWHFKFEGRDYRWKPTLLGAKDSDLICELIEYEISPYASSSVKKKKREAVATLKRKSENWDMIGDLQILKNAWQGVEKHRNLEILLVIGCLVMLDIIETS